MEHPFGYKTADKLHLDLLIWSARNDFGDLAFLKFYHFPFLKPENYFEYCLSESDIYFVIRRE